VQSTPDQTVPLRDVRGQPIILAFYPADRSPVCGDQMSLFSEILPEFRRYNAELLGISVDGVWSHHAFSHDRHLQFPLLADFEPKGAVGRGYGVYRQQDGTEERALFVIDAEGVIRWSDVSPVGVNPGADGILRAIDSLATTAEHSERNHSQTEPVQFPQPWILPARRGLEPRNDQRQYTTEDRHNRLLRIIRPDSAEGEEIDVAQDASIDVARLDPEMTVDQPLPAGHGGYIYLI
jgi:peroxiredoxin